MCTATNTLTPTGGSSVTGIGTSNITVDVQYLDSPVLSLDKSEMTENDTVTIYCDVISNPTVQMTITNTDNNTILVEEATNNKHVTISRAQCLHNGTYVCSVDNQGTNAKITSSRTLTVLYMMERCHDVTSSEIRYSLKEATQESAVSSSSTAAIVGGVVGVLVMVIIIVVVVILYRKGYNRTQKNGQQEEEDNRAYDTIGEPRESQANKTYSGLEHGTPQHYTGLTLHESTTDETVPESTVSQRLQDKIPVTYEGLELHAYEHATHEKKEPTHTNTTGQ